MLPSSTASLLCFPTSLPRSLQEPRQTHSHLGGPLPLPFSLLECSAVALRETVSAPRRGTPDPPSQSSQPHHLDLVYFLLSADLCLEQASWLVGLLAARLLPC